MSVKELVKAMGESRVNGNGSTPPDTPRKMSRSSSPKNPQAGSPRLNSRSSSPVPIPGMNIIELSLFSIYSIRKFIKSLTASLQFYNSKMFKSRVYLFNIIKIVYVDHLFLFFHFHYYSMIFSLLF